MQRSSTTITTTTTTTTTTQVAYAPSRNRQWHCYTATERADARSAPLRRTYMRGLVRQLGHPALLAATYSGNVPAAAAAAVAELEDCLRACLEELTREGTGGRLGSWGAALRALLAWREQRTC